MIRGDGGLTHGGVKLQHINASHRGHPERSKLRENIQADVALRRTMRFRFRVHADILPHIALAELCHRWRLTSLIPLPCRVLSVLHVAQPLECELTGLRWRDDAVGPERAFALCPVSVR